MGAKALPATVSECLKGFKTRMAAQGGVCLVPRKQSLDVIASLGLTIAEVEGIVLGLTEENYTEGPDQSRGGDPGGVWFLAHLDGGRRLYLELRLDEASAGCISLRAPGAASIQARRRSL